VGYQVGLVDQLSAERSDAQLPAAVAVRTGEPVWLESRQERDELFPALAGVDPSAVSVCAVPLVVGGHTLGALRFSFGSPRLFDQEERRFVLALAAQTAHALERGELNLAERRARDAAEELATRLTGLAGVSTKLAAARDARAVADVVVNEAADALEASVASLFILDGDILKAAGMRGVRADSEERWATYRLDDDLPAAEALRTGTTISVAGRDAIVARWPVFTGLIPDERSLVCIPLFAENRPAGVISLMFPGMRLPESYEATFVRALADTCAHALHRLAVTAEAGEAAARLQFLADASAALASSLDYRTTLARVARLAVPALADWCAIEMLDGSGQLRTLVAEHVDPTKVALALELQHRYPSDMNAQIGSANVVRTGVSEVIGEITDEMLVLGTFDAEHLELSRQLQLRSAMVVPLTARNRVLGTLTLIYAESDRRYDVSDLPFAEDLAQRAATSIDNARLFSETREVALRLQRALLPEIVNPVLGWDIAAHYSPAGEQAEVGGDWYDVVSLHDGRFIAVVGDVMGRGVAAAAAMAQMRATIRGFATVDPTPDVVLTRLDRMFDELDMTQFVTVLYVLIDVSSGEMQLASAGHLPPWVIPADGLAKQVVLPIGVPLGVGPDERVTTRALLPHGATLVAYTDGLIERRTIDLNIEALIATARTSDDLRSERLVTGLTEAAGVSVSHDDDVTVLAVRRS
jgi:GAF domain-containing protein